ncbi:MAG: ankyrin repeat domain-containing protein [Wolbachia endosymbiont of Tyrophagus putrescentiae]|nr:ankyrin repeat domain-containing protein [Wolbachia endosymbiont of Tyrophagus putrescentiae]
MQEALRERDEGEHEEWNGVEFDVNHLFEVVDEDNIKLKRTLLHLAAANGCTKIVDALLARGAKVDLVDKDRWTPLHWAAEKGHTETVNALLAKGADPLLKNNDGKTARDLALQNGCKKIDTLEEAEKRHADCTTYGVSKPSAKVNDVKENQAVNGIFKAV